VALIFSTVGREVLDGSGLGVSEGEAFSVTEAVWVSAGRVAVSVMVENAVFVDGCVPTAVGGIEVVVEVQAKAVRINRIGKIRVRLIGSYDLHLE
jgi:hypothetical protein